MYCGSRGEHGLGQFKVVCGVRQSKRQTVDYCRRGPGTTAGLIWLVIGVNRQASSAARYLSRRGRKSARIMRTSDRVFCMLKRRIEMIAFDMVRSLQKIIVRDTLDMDSEPRNGIWRLT